jgi:hypothetical protein
MRGRHQAPTGRRPRLRWLVGVAGAAIAGATVLALQPASAADTVNAQLSVTGVSTKANILGGSVIGIHPGETVNFKASALPTAGLENIPKLGPVLEDLLSTALGQYQVVVSFGPAFPGGAQTVTLGGPKTGKCAGLPAKSITFADKGTYTFTWKVQYVLPLLLGCAKNGVSDADLNLLAKAGVALNAKNSWVGKVVVADNPPAGGISIQLPGVSVAPNIAGHQLPTIGVPGITLPTLGLTVPNLAGGQGSGTAPPSSASTGQQSTGTGSGAEIPVPALVVPGPNSIPWGGGGGYAGAAGGNAAAAQSSPAALPTAAAQPARLKAPSQDSTGKHKTIDLAASRPSTGEVWVVLAIVAVIALTFVAATYARLYMLKQDSK